jgi:hypothetical protein
MISRRPRWSPLRRNGAFLIGASLALVAETAQAGHAPLVPEPRTILLRNGHPEHVVIGTRRGGYFVTRDAGATWSWICESGIGYDDEEVYPGALLESGTLVLSTGFGGVAISPDGCAWEPWLPSEQPFVADVRASGDRVVALEARAAGEAFVNQLWQSTDDGVSWSALGEPFGPDSRAVSFSLTESGEIYAASEDTSGAKLWHADAEGNGWSSASLTSEPAVTPRVVGARGTAADAHVYVVLNRARVEGSNGPGDRVVIARDGGASVETALDALGELSAWSLSSGAERLVVGGHHDGIYLLDSAAVDPALVRVSGMSVHALAWADDGRLYAAGHEATDGFSVGVSEDSGQTFSALFALCQVSGPLACAAGTGVGDQCSSGGEMGWDVRKEVANPEACVDDDSQGPSNAAGAAAIDESHGEPASQSKNDEETGCSLAGRSPTSSSSGLLMTALLALLWRRRVCAKRAGD